MKKEKKEIIVHNSKVEIIDNFLDWDSFNTIFEYFFSNRCKWQVGQVIPDEEDKSVDYDRDKVIKLCDDVDNIQFVKYFYFSAKPCKGFNIILNTLLLELDPAALIRIKANLNPRTEKIIRHGYHIDTTARNSKTAVYYVNDCDGFTEFDDGQRVMSKQNRIVIFDSHLPHTGSSCTNNRRRVVINLNYFPH